MTEAEWLTCTDPQPMLEELRGRVSERKLRLLLCGWSRVNWRWLTDASRDAVEIAERLADGQASDVERSDADARIGWTTQGWRSPIRNWWARLTLAERIDLWPSAVESISANPKAKREQAAVVRDVVSRPNFRPKAIDTAWLRWNHGTTPAIARHIYDERAFHDLPILGDALEDAGCTQADILAHCRSDGPHYRGCWVVDLLLGKDVLLKP